MKFINPLELRDIFNTAHSSGLTWRKIAALYKINVSYVYNLAVHGKEPRSLRIRRIFGLPPICPACLRRVPCPRPARLRRVPCPRPAIPAWVTEAADWLKEREK